MPFLDAEKLQDYSEEISFSTDAIIAFQSVVVIA